MELQAGHHAVRERAHRVALLTAMSVTTLNVWTGGPLLALWIGSRVQGQGPPAMAAIFVVAIAMGGISFVLLRVLSALGASYDSATGRAPTIRQHVPWLRSMRGERAREMGDKVGVSALDAVLVVSVVLAVLAFEIWFFFFSSSPIDQRSGR